MGESPWEMVGDTLMSLTVYATRVARCINSAVRARATFGLDEYGRYVERRGERFFIEPYPFWCWHPVCWWRHVMVRAEIVAWHLSRLTGVGWQ